MWVKGIWEFFVLLLQLLSLKFCQNSFSIAISMILVSRKMFISWSFKIPKKVGKNVIQKRWGNQSKSSFTNDSGSTKKRLKDF